MYTVQLRKSNKILTKCIVNDMSTVKIINLLFDTGAVNTVIDSSVLRLNKKDLDLSNCETKNFIGVTSNSKIIAYKIPISQFTVGNIDLGKQDIWVVFDGRMVDSVLGMDLLSKITYLYSKDTENLYLFNNIDEAVVYIADLQKIINSANTAGAFRKLYGKGRKD